MARTLRSELRGAAAWGWGATALAWIVDAQDAVFPLVLWSLALTCAVLLEWSYAD